MAPPLVFESAADMRKFVRAQRREGKTIGFVPTMVRFGGVRSGSERQAAPLQAFCTGLALPPADLHS